MTKRTPDDRKAIWRIKRTQFVFPIPTVEEFFASRCGANAWSGMTLAQWGVFYPLTKGWQKRLLSLSKAGQKEWGGWRQDQEERRRQEFAQRHATDAST